MKLKTLALATGFVPTSYSGLLSTEMRLTYTDTDADERSLADGRAIFTTSNSF